MSAEQIDPNAGQYDEAQCPMQGCEATLYIEWSLFRPIYLSDAVADLQGPRGSITAQWSVACSEGHVVLLPAGCDDNEVFGSEPYAEDGEFRDDFGRLRRLIGVQP